MSVSWSGSECAVLDGESKRCLSHRFKEVPQVQRGPFEGRLQTGGNRKCASVQDKPPDRQGNQKAAYSHFSRATVPPKNGTSCSNWLQRFWQVHSEPLKGATLSVGEANWPAVMSPSRLFFFDDVWGGRGLTSKHANPNPFLMKEGDLRPRPKARGNWFTHNRTGSGNQFTPAVPVERLHVWVTGVDLIGRLISMMKCVVVAPLKRLRDQGPVVHHHLVPPSHLSLIGFVALWNLAHSPGFSAAGVAFHRANMSAASRPGRGAGGQTSSAELRLKENLWSWS